MIVLLFALVLPILGACAGGQAPTPQVDAFQTLAPPDEEQLPLTLFYSGNSGNVSQLLDVVGPDVIVNFRRTTQSVGGMGTETVSVPRPDQRLAVATTRMFEWGDYFGSRVRRTTYYDQSGKLLRGVIQLSIPYSSVMQLFKGRVQYEYDKSRLYLIYDSEGKGKPVFKGVVYGQEYGLGKDRVFLGTTYVWLSPASLDKLLPQEYHRWGFWTKSSDEWGVVTKALDAVHANAEKVAADYSSQDTDGLREIIGRQTGFHLFQQGTEVGKIELDYQNNFGRMPNTVPFGSGALSRVHWRMTDGSYFGIVTFSPLGTPQAASLIVFVDDEAVGNQIAATNASTVMEALNGPGIPHALFGVYMSGDISKQYLVVPGAKHTDGRQDPDTTIDLGTFGGVSYSLVGHPNHAQALAVRDHLDLIGEGGMNAIGFKYPTKPNSGTGLHYYISILTLLTCDGDQLLNTIGCDVGLLDRVGMAGLH
jgi:hypothetical protein